MANWTRGDRKARFEQTAERHAGLSQFAAPFLTRMKFVDEQGEGTSPTLSALRVYREHRAAGRRGLPHDAPLDFAPAALQPLIRRDSVTDRRRYAPEPAGAGFFGDILADRTLDRRLDAPDARLGAPTVRGSA